MTLPDEQLNWRARLSQPETAPPWSWLDAASALIALLLGMLLLGPAAAVLLAGLESENLPLTLLFGWTLGGLVTLLFLLTLPRRIDGFWAALGMGPTRQALPLLLLAGVAAAVTVDLIAGSLSRELLPVPQLVGLRGAGAAAWLLAAFFLLVVRPAAEELVFRGLLLPHLRLAAGPWGGLLLSALLYALFCFLVYDVALPEGAVLWYRGLLPLLLGLFLGAVRVVTGSTRAALLVHAGGGLLALLTALILAV